MNAQPLRDFVLIRKDEGPKQTAGGIFMPGTADEKNVTGTVVAVGSGRVTADGQVLPLEVRVGDKVVFNKNYAAEVKVDAETLLLLKEENLYCIIR